MSLVCIQKIGFLKSNEGVHSFLKIRTSCSVGETALEKKSLTRNNTRMNTKTDSELSISKKYHNFAESLQELWLFLCKVSSGLVCRTHAKLITN